MGLLDRVATRLGYTAQRTVPGMVREAVDRTVREYALAWPSPLLAGSFGGGGSSTGIPVTPLSALQSAAVYACVRRKAEDIAKLPVLVERDAGREDWQRDELHPLNNLLRRPNSWMTAFEFWRYMVSQLELRGNAIAVILRDWRGVPEQIIPLNWDRAMVLLSPAGHLFYNVSHPQIGFGVTFHQDDVLHLRGVTVDGGYLGMSAIMVAQDVVGLAIGTQQHGSVLFRNGAQLSGLLKHPGKLSPEAAKRLEQSFHEAYGGVQNAHKFAVLEEGMGAEKMSMTSEEAQFLQTRGFQVLEICRLFGVPPHKVYSLEKANFSTLEQQEQAYVNDALLPLGRSIQDACSARLFFSDEIGRWRIRIDFDEMLRGDQKARSEFYQSGLLNGWLSVNEVRRKESLPPIQGGDVYRVPVNTTPIVAANAAGVPGAGAPAPQSQPAPAESQDVVPLESETADNDVF